MTDTVYASAGGDRYHANPSCRAFELGQNLNDIDCDCWYSCIHGRTWAVAETSAVAARADGKTPCRRCFTAAVDLGPSEDDYGHQPVPNQHCGQSCRRCTTTVTHYDEAYQPSRWTKAVRWPCTTAQVLGLAPRSAA